MRALRILAQYHRPGFHSNDRDTTRLIADWKQALFGGDGRLTGLLAGWRQHHPTSRTRHGQAAVRPPGWGAQRD